MKKYRIFDDVDGRCHAQVRRFLFLWIHLDDDGYESQQRFVSAAKSYMAARERIERHKERSLRKERITYVD
jgi:hypothetical protein